MKYTPEQKHLVIKQGLNIQRASVFLRKTISEQFPVKVEIIDNFYVIESKINTIEL